MNRRPWHPILFGVAVAALACTSAFAQSTERGANDQPRADKDATARSAAVAPIPADAPGVRLAGLIRRDGVILRNKNIQSVQRIAAGIFCITPKPAAGITPNNAVVTLTPEYYYSLYNEIKVQWATQGSGCGPNKIAVYTLADVNLNAVYTFSNAVSFSIIVP